MPEILLLQATNQVSGDTQPLLYTARSSRRCHLILTAGVAWIKGNQEEETRIQAPALIQWWPGEEIQCRFDDANSRGLLLEGLDPQHPDGFPPAGSRVRAKLPDGLTVLGNVVSYYNSSPVDGPPNKIVLEIEGQGIGHISIDSDITVLEQPRRLTDS